MGAERISAIRIPTGPVASGDRAWRRHSGGAAGSEAVGGGAGAAGSG